MVGRRQVSTTNAQKLKTIERVSNGEKVNDVAASCHVDRATIWRRQRQAASNQTAQSSCAYTGEKTQLTAVSHDIELRLLAWVKHMRSTKYFCISTECIRYALAYFDPDYTSTRSRDAVKMYIFRFLRRNRLTYRRITHRERVARPGMQANKFGVLRDLQLVADRFAEATVHLLESNAFFPIGMNDRYSYLFNMDQTSVCVDMNPHSTIEFVGSRTVDVVQSTTPDSFRASIFLCASPTGKKMRPLVVFAGVFGADVHDELRADPAFDWSKAHFTVQAKAYCDERVMKEWVDELWCPDMRGPSMLLLDSLKTHKMESVKNRLETDGHAHVIYVPPGMTGLAEPMDVAVMKPFKDRCRDKYLKFVIEGGVFTTPSQKRRKIAEMVVQAWDEISVDSIRNGLLKAGLIATGPRDVVECSPHPNHLARVS